jgi:hypothetical protein
MLHSVGWNLVTTFLDTLSAPSSGVKQSKKIASLEIVVQKVGKKTANLRCVTSLKSKDVIDTAAES